MRSSHVLLFALHVSLSGSANSAESSARSIESRLSSFIEFTATENEFRGAVLVAKEGTIVHASATGKLGDGSDAPIEIDTLFEIASLTKSFTGVAAMKLVETEQLDLDESIATYLPGIPDECQAITVRHLLQHTSGIPGTNYQGRGTDLSAVIPSFLAGGPQHEPGTRFEYWNQGYALLSEIIARASGKSYVDFTRAAIFEPAGMASSYFVGETLREGDHCATGASSRGEDRLAIKPPYAENYGFEYRGMGGIVTNIHDLFRFDRVLADGTLLTPESIQEMTTIGRGNYALGWRITKGPDGEPYHFHSGRSPGFTASFSRYPGNDGCVVVLASDDKGPGLQSIVKGCGQIIFNLNSDPDAGEKKYFTSIEGKYRDADGQSLIIKASNARAYMDIFWNDKIDSGTISRTLAGSLEWIQSMTVSRVRRPIEFEIEEGKPVTCIFDSIRFVRDE